MGEGRVLGHWVHRQGGRGSQPPPQVGPRPEAPTEDPSHSVHALHLLRWPVDSQGLGGSDRVLTQALRGLSRRGSPLGTETT